MRNHLFFFSTDKHASPFDINIALDAGFDVVIPYPGVEEADVRDLTHDIIFSRGPKGAKHSGIFVGGSDLGLVEQIVRIASESIFDPFTVSIFSDPKGAYTTAAALVAKAGQAAGGLAGKKVVVFGGTGPVGRIAAVLCAKEGAETTIVTSRTPQAGKEAAARTSRDFGVTIHGAAAQTEQERIGLIAGADIAMATVKAGVQVVSETALAGLTAPVIVADVNAVPPSGFGGLEPHDDGKEISGAVRGIGALAVGVVKYKVEVAIFQAMLDDKIIAGHDKAYEFAKTMV